MGGDVRRDLVNSATYLEVISVPILFGAFAIADSVMQSGLFGSTFANAPGAVLIGIALMQVLNAYQKPFDSAIAGVDRPDIIFRVSLLVTVIYVPAAVGFGHLYGLIGVIAGTVIAETVRLVAYQYMSVRLFDGAVFPKPVGHQLLAAGVMFGVVEGVSQAMNLDEIITLGLLIIIGAVVYFLLLMIISQHFRSTISRTLDDFQ